MAALNESNGVSLDFGLYILIIKISAVFSCEGKSVSDI